MNKINRRFILIILLITSLLLCSCSQGQDNTRNHVQVTTSLVDKPVLVGNISCEFPLVKKDTSLNILTTIREGVDPAEIFVWKTYEEMTGIKINWTSATKEERREKVYNALMNQNDLDLIMRCKISPSLLTQYGESGLILDLAKDDLLKIYAPNCYKYLQSHPDALASITNPDGTIYSLPQINSGAELRVNRKIFVNKNWLKNTGMELPTTTEEFYQMLKVFKEQDANGNGDPDDEIPFTSRDWQSVQEAFLGSFGLGNRGLHNDIVDCDETTGKVRLIVEADGYLDYLKYFNRLYQEGLMDNQIFTTAIDTWESNIARDRIGVFISTNLSAMPSENEADWVAIGEALEGPNGDKMWSAVRANFHSTGAAVIPASCDDPGLVLRWLDYFWTDEGTLFYHMGTENETFIVMEDGSYDYTPKLYEEIKETKTSFDDTIALYSPYPGGSNPTVEIAPYFMGGEMAEVPAAAARTLFQYGPKEYWPSFTFTAEESDRLEIITSDLSKYYNTAREDFITGKMSFDQWDAYKTRLDSLGVVELLGIYQSAVERYETMSHQ